ncbi:putative poly(ADP-ribose) polymerase, catalytic domain, RST domain-containing protein [Helianthus debilis subsp. tardiflorus]
MSSRRRRQTERKIEMRGEIRETRCGAGERRFPATNPPSAAEPRQRRWCSGPTSFRVESATADEYGIKHILLCRVLLGKSELVSRGSTQCYPSSDDFQSGVDDLLSPKKLIVWSSQMNTHILPEFVISFKTLSSINGPKSDGVPVRHEKPVSPWIPIPNLIAALSKILAPKAIKEITQFRRSYIEHKISRREMIRGIREVTGDRLLLMVLKDFTQQRRSKRLG